MCVFDVLPHGAGVCVALVAPRVLASIRLAGDVSLHVLGAIAGVVKFLGAPLVVALVGFFARVRSGVKLQVLQAGKGAPTGGDFTAIRLFSGVTSQVSGELVASVKWLQVPRAFLPEADVLGHGEGVASVQVYDQTRQGWEFLMAPSPPTDHLSIT